MSRTSKTIGALALLALIGAAVAWAVIPGGDSDATTAASGPPALTAPQPPNEKPVREKPAQDKQAPEKPAQEKRVGEQRVQKQPVREKLRLGLSDRGQPIVWLRRGAQIPIRSAPAGKVIKSLGWQTPFKSRTVLSVFRQVGQWAGVPTPLLPTGRLGWVKLDPSKLRTGWTPYAIDIDLSQRAGQLRRGNRVLRSFPVTVGAPGTSTPTGRFAVTDIFRGNLNPAYGCCAIATTARQLHLPSGWIGGDRIAIHGTTGPLGVAASHGCVRAANEDLSALVKRVALGSPVLIRQ
jgi:L,D-transpeptidase catalytic domain